MFFFSMLALQTNRIITQISNERADGDKLGTYFK